MAENLETPNFGNFSIENTMETGAGSVELLKDLFAPETASSNPDEIQTIDEPASQEKAPAQKPAGKLTTVEAPTKNEEEEATKKSLESFLSGDDTDEEDDEDQEEIKKPVAKTKSPVADALKETKEEEAPEDGEQAESQEVTQFGALAKDLAKLGVFSVDEDEELNISTPEEFLDRFQEEKRRGAIDMVNNFIGQFGEDYQSAFQAIFVKGVDPKEYFGAYNNIVNFSEMDLSNESNQVTVIKQALADQGFEAEDIDTEVERLKNYGDLESVATKHHKVLVKKEAAKLRNLEERSQQELQQKQAFKNQYIQNVQGILQDKLKAKEFDGIPLNPKLAGELQDFLLVDKYRTQSGETITDFDRAILELKRPENHEMKVKVALLLKILEKDPTLSTIQKNGVSKKSNQLFGEVARQASRAGKSTSSTQKPNSWFI